MSLLQKVDSPADVKRLTEEECTILAEELRREIIKTVSKQGGHLASNLGVVELTIAMHKVFNSPEDKFIWDVGHQSYVHKILTGRGRLFQSLRKTDVFGSIIVRFIYTEYNDFLPVENIAKDVLEGCCQLVALANREVVELFRAQSDIASRQFHITVSRQIESRLPGKTLRLFL